VKKIYKRSLSATSIGILLVYLVYYITPNKTAQRALNKIKDLKPLDVVIVPGVPFENGKWDAIMKARVLWSVILYKNGYTRNIIYSGSAVYSPYKEGVIMGLYAQQLGIPKEHIFYETQARHSTENIYFSYLEAKKQGFKTIGLATDPFQSTFLKYFMYRRFATPIYQLPIVADSIESYQHLDPNIYPVTAQVNNFVSIVQKESFTQRIKGTLGYNIDFSQYKRGKVPAL